jgi:hypothetical protein
MNLSDYLTCSNCTYEVDEASELGYCQNCQRAYDLGKESGRE